MEHSIDLAKKDVVCGFELLITLTPTLSQRERASGSLSLWERVGVRVKFDEGTRFQCYKISLNKYNNLIAFIFFTKRSKRTKRKTLCPLCGLCSIC